MSGDGAGKNLQSLEHSPELIAEKVTNLLNQLAESSGVSIRACNGHINFYSATKQAGWMRWLKKLLSLKGLLQELELKGVVQRSLNLLREKDGSLSTVLKRSSFDPEEYALYRKYQIRVHNDTPEHVTESSYKRFLVDTPLVFVPPTSNGSVASCGFGSFHQQYLIDGRLVAVGVIDILPRCLSSKYLFWDPDLAFLSLGKYSALQEIDWVKQSQLSCPSLEYYYLGYYIHSCNKMRYKAAYRPSELLCPLRYQ